MKLNIVPTSTWLSAEEAQSEMSSATWALVSCPGSLTEHLRQASNNSMMFRLLFANWGYANPMEREMLGLAPEVERTWVRCIEHRCQGRLWVYARTIFPESTIAATQDTLSGLGIQSLGDIIFKDPSLRRGPFSYCLLNENSQYYPTPGAWARRSIVYFQEQAILITEIFMPESYA